MLPLFTPSSRPLQADLLPPDDRPRNLLLDYERGGVHINDPSMGLNYQNWKAWYEDGHVKIATEFDEEEMTFFSSSYLTELALAFDQNMRPAVVYVESGVAKLRWFDAAIGGISTTSFLGATTPLICLDDRRDALVSGSDILVFYVRNGSLCVRIQRERFLIEHVYQALSSKSSKLLSLGMNRQNRIQIYVKG